MLFAHILVWIGCSALTCKAAVDHALAEIEAHREAHRQKERDLQIQTQASNQAAEQIPSMRYHNRPMLHSFIICSLDTVWQVVLYMNTKWLLCCMVACRFTHNVTDLLSICTNYIHTQQQQQRQRHSQTEGRPCPSLLPDIVLGTAYAAPFCFSHRDDTTVKRMSAPPS